FNSFAAELAPLMRRYFTSTTQNNDPDIYEKGYVGSDDVTEYDRILEALLKDKMAGRRALSEELSPTRAREPKLTAALRVRLETSARITKLSQHEADGREFQERKG